MSFVFNPMDPEVLRNPYPTYKRMRNEYPVYRHPAGFWALTRYQDVSEALKDAATFSSSAMGQQNQQMMGEGIGRSLISEDPPTHTEQRNIVPIRPLKARSNSVTCSVVEVR